MEPNATLLSSTSELDASGEHWQQVKKACEYWQRMDLKSQKSKLDKQGLEIAEYREKSGKQRKHLAQITRDFKKLTEAEKAEGIGKLLKSYQEEIDALTRRSTSSETAFLELYTMLRDAPDPFTTLSNILGEEQKLSHASRLEKENRELAKKIEEYELEFKELQNQDVTIRRLEEKVLSLQSQSQINVEKEIERTKQEWQREHQEILQKYKEKEQMAAQQLQASMQQHEEIMALYKASQNELFSLQSSVAETQASYQSQIDVLNEDVSDLSSKIDALKAENDSLRMKLKASAGGGDELSGNSNELKELHVMELSQKDKEIQALQAKLDSLTEKYEKTLHVNEEKETSQKQLQKQIDSLQKQLASRPTNQEHEKVTSRLKMLEELNFSSLQTESNVDISSQSIEQLLQMKNRKLDDELTHMKNSFSTASKELEALREQNKTLETTCASQKQLVQKLEEDLVTMKAKNSSVGESSTITTPATSSQGEQQQEGTSTSGDSDMLLKIVSDQRNRFRQRLNEVEEEKQTLENQVKQLEIEVKKLKQDNLKMYERIRYLESYQSTPTATTTTKRTSVEDLEEGNVEQKYKNIYEQQLQQQMNPVQQFLKKERSEQYKKMNAAERIALSASNLFLSNKFGRLFLFFYTVALHFLVFMTVYAAAHNKCKN